MSNTAAPCPGSSERNASTGCAWILICAIALYALVRGMLLFNSGYEDDVIQYKEWAVQAARFGISEIYRSSDMDYPPLYAYILQPFGQLYLWSTPGAMQYPRDTTLLTILVKLPPLLFDVGISVLLFRWTRRQQRPAVLASIAAAAYLFNPAVLFDGAYWGEPDSIYSFFVLAAFIAVGSQSRFRPSASSSQPRLDWGKGFLPAWIFLTLASAMKPLAAPYFPLLLAVTAMLYGCVRTIAGIGAAVATALTICIPFLARGDARALFHRIVGDVGAMPFTSSNAHNLWWLLGPWRNAEVPWLGPFTATEISLLLFAVAYMALLCKAYILYRAQAEVLSASQIIALAALVGFSFFIFSTHMHENHMFAVVPLLAPLIPQDRIWRRLFIAASCAVFLNLLLHDLVIPERWPFTIGGLSRVENLQLGKPFHVAAITAIWISTAFNLGLYLVSMAGVLKKSGWLENSDIVPHAHRAKSDVEI